MITILIVDDDAIKIKVLKAAILEISDIKENDIEIATDKQNAKRLLYEKQFDLMILDLSLPERFGDDPEITGGTDFLREINLDDEFILPFHIIGLTAYPSLHEAFLEAFSKNLWHLIIYDSQYNNWKYQLHNFINYLIKSKAEIRNPSNIKYEYDIAIVTAITKPELESILRLDCNWEEFKFKNDHTIYYKGIFKNSEKSLRIVAASADQMGLTATSNLSQKLIYNFRPKYLVMTGIAAGVKGKGNYGDIMIADISWDYGSGKMSTTEDGSLKFKQDPRPLSISIDLKQLILKEQLSGSIKEFIERKWTLGCGVSVQQKLQILVGPIASGSYVIENIKKVQEVIDQQRKLIGIDMEAYAVFFAAEHSNRPKPIPLVIKSICDFGDENKNDTYQKYAAFTSANFLYYFALIYL